MPVYGSGSPGGHKPSKPKKPKKPSGGSFGTSWKDITTPPSKGGGGKAPAITVNATVGSKGLGKKKKGGKEPAPFKYKPLKTAIRALSDSDQGNALRKLGKSLLGATREIAEEISEPKAKSVTPAVRRGAKAFAIDPGLFGVTRPQSDPRTHGGGRSTSRFRAEVARQQALNEITGAGTRDPRMFTDAWYEDVRRAERDARKGGASKKRVEKMFPDSSLDLERTASRTLARSLDEIRKANPRAWASMSREQRMKLATRLGDFVTDKDARKTKRRTDASAPRFRDLDIPDLNGRDMTEAQIAAAVRGARKKAMRRSARSEADVQTKIALRGQLSGHPSFTVREGLRSPDRNVRASAVAQLQEQVNQGIVLRLARDLAPTEKISARPRDKDRPTTARQVRRSLEEGGILEQGIADVPGLSNLIAAAQNAPGEAADIATGIIPGAWYLVTHPGEIDNTIKEAVESSAIYQAATGNFGQAQRTATESPLTTALDVAGVSAVAGRSITGLARAGALGKAQRARIGNLARPDIEDALSNARLTRPDYSKNYLRARRQRAADRRARERAEENRVINLERIKAQQAGRDVPRDARGREIKPRTGRSQQIRVPGTSFIVDNRFASGRKHGSRFVPTRANRRDQSTDPLDPLGVRGAPIPASTKAAAAALQRGVAVERLSLGELASRLQAALPGERYLRAIQPSILPAVLPSTRKARRAAREYNIPKDREAMALVAYAAAGIISPDNALRELTDLQQKVKRAESDPDVRKYEAMRDANASAQEQYARLVEYVRRNPDLVAEGSNLWNAARLFAKGNPDLGIPGQNLRDLRQGARGVRTPEQMERARLSGGAFTRGDLRYDPTLEPSYGRRALGEGLEYRRSLRAEEGTRTRKLRSAQRRRARVEGKMEALGQKRNAPPTREVIGRGRGRPLQQAAKFVAQQVRVREQEKKVRALARRRETAVRAYERQVGGTVPKYRQFEEKLLNEIPEYVAARDELKVARREMRKLQKQARNLETGPEVSTIRFNELRRREVKDPARAISTRAGLIRTKMADVQARIDRANSVRRSIRAQFQEAGLIEKALREAKSGRESLEDVAAHIDDLQGRIQTLNRRIENDEISFQDSLGEHAALVRQLESEYRKWGERAANELSVPGLRSMLTARQSRVQMLEAIMRERARRTLTDEEAKEVGTLSRAIEDEKRFIADLERGIERYLPEDQARAQIDLADNLAQAMVLRRDFTRAEGNPTEKRRINERLADVHARIDNLRERFDLDLERTMRDLEEAGPETPGEVRNALDRRDDIVKALDRFSEFENVEALIEYGKELGLHLPDDIDFSEGVARVVAHETGLDPSLQSFLQLPRGRDLLADAMPDALPAQMDKLARVAGDEVEADTLLREAQKALDQDRITLEELRQTAPRLTPNQTRLLARVRAEEAARKVDLDQVKRGLKQAQDQIKAARVILRRERGAGIRGLMPRGIVDSDGRKLTNRDLEALYDPRTLDHIAFLTQRPAELGTGMFRGGGKALDRPTVDRKVRTGQALPSGLMHFDEGSVLRQINSGERMVAMIDGLDDLMSTIRVGDYRTKGAAEKASRQFHETNPHLGRMIPVRLGPLYNAPRYEASKIRERTTARPLARMDDEGVPSDRLGLEDFAGVFDEMTADGEGNWTLVPELPFRVAQRQAANMPVGFLDFIRSLNQTFKANVLPFSAKWHEGNIIDNTLRSTAYFINPADWRSGSMFLKSIEDIHGKEVGDQARMELMGVGHFGSRGTADTRGYGRRANRAGRALTDSPLGGVWRMYDRVRNGSFRFSDFYEEKFRTGALGRQVRQDLRNFEAKMGRGVKSEQELIDALAQGYSTRGPLRQRYFNAVNDILGDYVTRGPEFRQIVDLVAPFGLWIRNALKFAMVTLPFKHPIKTAMLVNIAKLRGDEYDDLGLPTYLRGVVPASDEPGSRVLRLGEATSLGSLFSPAEFGAEAVSGGVPFGLILGLRGEDPFGRDLDPYGQLAEEGLFDTFDKAMLGLRNVYEGMFPPSRYARTFLEKGAVAQPGSNIFDIQTKPGTELSLSENLRRLFDITWVRDRVPGSTESDVGGVRDPGTGGTSVIDPDGGDVIEDPLGGEVRVVAP